MTIYSFIIGLVLMVLGVASFIGRSFFSTGQRRWQPAVITAIGIAIMTVAGQFASVTMSHLISLR